MPQGQMLVLEEACNNDGCTKKGVNLCYKPLGRQVKIEVNGEPCIELYFPCKKKYCDDHFRKKMCNKCREKRKAAKSCVKKFDSIKITISVLIILVIVIVLISAT